VLTLRLITTNIALFFASPCVCVCVLLDTPVSPAQTAEPIET